MILIELGPILTALVLAGRVGSALAAEIGSMREKKRLDAYTVLGLDTYRYLALLDLLPLLQWSPV
jgi:phospholipid/cholesterol/gamma-HCH transport system permease protein